MGKGESWKEVEGGPAWYAGIPPWKAVGIGPSKRPLSDER